ncbi:MAG TPA: ATP-binding protein [Candidatus Acidoferrales bacterium]|nr:ATP-binding protein [Candidatus Acidoferrales bacterium]
MNIYSIPPLVTAVLALFLFFFVTYRNPSSVVKITFATLCFLTAYWQGTWTVLFNASERSTISFLVKAGYSGIIFIPIVFFHFLSAFTNGRAKLLVGFFYGLGGIFFLALWLGDLFIDGTYRYPWGFYPKAGMLHPVYLAALCSMLFCGLYLLLEYRREISFQPIKLNQVNYVIVSTAIYSLSASDFLVNYGFNYYPFGFVFTTAYTLMIAYAIVQYRLLDINVVFKRSLIYASLLLLLLIPCYLLVVLAQVFTFGKISFGFSFVTLALLVVVGFLFPKLRFRTQEALERVLFKKRYDYRETLLRSSKDMISVVNLETLANKLVNTVSTALGIEKASLYLADEAQGYFDLKSTTGGNPAAAKEPRLARDDPLVQRLIRRPEPLVREELEFTHNGDRRQRDLAERMAELEAEVSLPLITQERLIGILNIGHKEGKEMYSNEDLEVLATLANQAAIAIENARLYDNLKQSQRVLQRADRLSSLGMLTAGLAHEIRNPLVAIRTFTQLLPERYQDQDFRTNFQSLALKEVDRICNLITDLLSFARPSAPNVSVESVNDIVENVARILETEAKERDVKIQFRLTPDLPPIFVDKEQMKQVFMNIILNAIQSIEGGGVVEISSRLFVSSDSHKFVQIRIHDSGVGIPEKDIENIFNPFFTTKKGGSGLGLSISHQIVQEHAGYIAVESKVGQGTSFYINLPVSPLAQKESRGSPPPHEHEKDPGR